MIENRVVSLPPCCVADDRIVFGQRVDLGQRRRLIKLVVGRRGDGLRHELGRPADIDLRAARPRAVGDGVRHLLDVAVGGIVEDEDTGHEDLRCAHGA